MRLPRTTRTNGRSRGIYAKVDSYQNDEKEEHYDGHTESQCPYETARCGAYHQ